ARRSAIVRMERMAVTEGYTQIFIEAPYRNDKLLAVLLKTLAPTTKLTVARNITSPEESIKTDTVAGWRKKSTPLIGKVPTIFLIGR
ncbi:MAG: SAM-dependent methyltransferase, partial [Rikenellaceae bacterium]|nr:SAM-dependent methyltransferase [Rikenellaceae bacterium]